MASDVRRCGVVVLAALLTVGVVSALPASAEDGPVVSMGDQSGLERDSVTGSVFMPVYLSAPAAEPVVVSFSTADGTAAAGSDYQRWGTPGNPRTATILPGATQTQINVPVLADNHVESDETFSVVISSVSGSGATVGDDTGIATIVDSDAASAVNPAITVSNPTVIEGDQGDRRAQFLVHLSRAPASNVTITYATADGSAVAGQDYTAKLPGTVVFAPGQISKTIDVTIRPNTVVESTRAFGLDVAVIGGSPVEELNLTGIATIVDDDATVPVPTSPDEVAVGSSHSCLLADGTVKCWGYNAYGQLGDGTTTQSLTPVPVAGITGATDLSAGFDFGCAVVDSGVVKCWGANYAGQLGDGTTTNASIPVEVSGARGALQVAAGADHACALLVVGTVKCWGRNFFGQLGNGQSGFPQESLVPVDVVGLSDVVSISTGAASTCGLLAGGTVKCWGGNTYGQVGNGTTVDSSLPSAVSGVSGATALASGFHHACATVVGGGIRCWGRNHLGQLGDGRTTDSSTAVVVSGITGATTIGLGSFHSCAAGPGLTRCWGTNANGQLGNGTMTGSATPVQVSGPIEAPSISGGSSHTCAVISTGVECWGGNSAGQLGTGTTTRSLVPVAVVGLT